MGSILGATTKNELSINQSNNESFRKFIKKSSIFSSNSEFRDFNFREIFSIEKNQFNDSFLNVDFIMKAKDFLSIKYKKRSSKIKNKRSKKRITSSD